MFHIWCLHSLARKIGEQGQKLCNIHQETLRRDSRLDLTAKIWAPPSNFHILNEVFVLDADKLTVNEVTGTIVYYYYDEYMVVAQPTIYILL